MKVLHINHSDIGGGASIGAYRIHRGLRELGIDSRLLVRESLLGESETTVLRQKWYDKELVRWGKRLGFKCVAPITPLKVLNTGLYRDSDVVHVHNLHSGFFNLNFLTRCTKPIVWTLHDMWPMTGDCIYSNACPCWDDRPNTAYNGQCIGDCQCKRDHAAHANREREIKKRIYAKSSLTVACTSRWLVEHAESSILRHKPIVHIPYGIDTSLYQPLDKAQCRSVLRLPQGSKIILNVSEALNDPRKGVDLLAAALTSLPANAKRNLTLVTMGRIAGSPLAAIDGIKSVHLGYVASDLLKTIVYSAADVFVMPTRADTFGLVLQESMACGTPSVAFRVGGVTDPVRHEETGLLAEPEDAGSLSIEINRLLTDDELRIRLGDRCRSVCVAEYDRLVVSEQYLSLYNSLVGERHNRANTA